MQSKPRGLAIAAVLCAIAHGVSAVPAANNMDKPSAASVETKSVTVPATATATATLQPDSPIESAAAAARRDQDPDLNGSMKTPIPAEAPAASLAR